MGQARELTKQSLYKYFSFGYHNKQQHHKTPKQTTPDENNNSLKRLQHEETIHSPILFLVINTILYIK